MSFPTMWISNLFILQKRSLEYLNTSSLPHSSLPCSPFTSNMVLSRHSRLSVSNPIGLVNIPILKSKPSQSLTKLRSTLTKNIWITEKKLSTVLPTGVTKMRPKSPSTPCLDKVSHRGLRINSFTTRPTSMEILPWTSRRKEHFTTFRIDYTYVCAKPRFVHTWMPPEGEKIFLENINKNIVDLDEYPASANIHSRCVSMSTSNWFVVGHGGYMLINSQLPIFGKHPKIPKQLELQRQVLLRLLC